MKNARHGGNSVMNSTNNAFMATDKYPCKKKKKKKAKMEHAEAKKKKKTSKESRKPNTFFFSRTN